MSAALLAILALFSPSAPAAELPAREEPSAQRRVYKPERQLVLKPTLYTNGRTVRTAFKQVAATAKHATVRVYSGEILSAHGVVVGEAGWILSKASEVQGETTIELVDGRKLPAVVVASDEPTDLALLKVEATELTPIQWQTDPVEIGQWIINPGLEETPLAIGVLSTLARNIKRVHVPGILGIRLNSDGGPPTVEEVFPDRAAATAGIKVGDIIEQAQGKTFDRVQQFQQFVMGHGPGEKLELTLRRGEEKLDVQAILSYPTDVYLSRIAQQNHMGGGLSIRRTGFDAALQHDSVLNPVECGGPALDLSGKAVGLNIARAGRTETYCLPAEIVISVVTKLMQTPEAIAATTPQPTEGSK